MSRRCEPSLACRCPSSRSSCQPWPLTRVFYMVYYYCFCGSTRLALLASGMSRDRLKSNCAVFKITPARWAGPSGPRVEYRQIGLDDDPLVSNLTPKKVVRIHGIKHGNGRFCYGGLILEAQLLAFVLDPDNYLRLYTVLHYFNSALAPLGYNTDPRRLDSRACLSGLAFVCS